MPKRKGFTLVELLIVITIIAILAAMTLFSLHSMTEFGKESSTRSRITKIDRLLIGWHWELYRTRPMPIKVPPGTQPKQANQMRLRAVREMMRLEMPDRISEVKTPPLFLAYSTSQERYRRRALPGWSTKYQGAECLYMIIASIQEGDRNGLDFFNSNEIGDKDGDGMFEFVDGWGNPIEFIRWPAGFESVIQDRDRNNSPDPFDPLKADTRWGNTTVQNALFSLHPLIVSAGPDKEYGVYGITTVPTIPGNNNDPYVNYGSRSSQLGYSMNGDAPDNIHNHSLTGR